MSQGIVLWGVKSIFYILSFDDNREYKCVIKGKVIDTEFNIKNRRDVSPIIAGDIVEFDKTINFEGVITKRFNRKNELKRLKNGGREVQTLVSNVDQILIVDSIYNPPLRSFFIDRILFTADVMSIPIKIVINKIDLIDSNIMEFYNYLKESYNRIGYEILEVSANKNIGIDLLKSIMKDKITSFTGRSGVGKSSLVRAVDLKYKDIKIGEVSKKYDRGVHTTTYAQLYPLSSGGFVVDTPGIREFSIFLDKPEDVEINFRDFDNIRDDCKYPNCQHLDEPGCAVREALEEKKIEPFRYESYLRMRETIEKLKDSRI